MAPSPLLYLPSELRLEIYKYLVPTRNRGIRDTDFLDGEHCSADNMRLVCRQVTSEFEHELLKDMARYHSFLPALFPCPISVESAHTFRETKYLHISLASRPSYSYHEDTVAMVLASKLLQNCVPPHIRYLHITIRSGPEPEIDVGDGPTYAQSVLDAGITVGRLTGGRLLIQKGRQYVVRNRVESST
ncbi:hypothetical protein K491DRAFT_716237 [Lophiostoma macrostomum CBS 122681]|uniref:F-box domain-containing protein n=1 Tax=Lophiostoma macrostomum CBS 122681 TaxID=1314788 RepID=A0A6A6T6X4_9PLEO|nr:hypothetical protein K491DRAFT_716237 [Lophiostoma macrostomum CBS 122681]